MSKTTRKTDKQRPGPTAAAAVESLLGSKSLCDTCIWDCVQPLGRTVVCPYWEKRAPEAARLSRRGQQKFAFADVAATNNGTTNGTTTR